MHSKNSEWQKLFLILILKISTSSIYKKGASEENA
jgi:hypothetical protein